MSTIISASEARSNLYSLLDEVASGVKKFVITNKGKAKAVLISPEEFEAWEETLEIMADKRLMKNILKSEEERKRKDTVSEKELLASLGLVEEDLKNNEA